MWHRFRSPRPSFPCHAGPGRGRGGKVSTVAGWILATLLMSGCVTVPPGTTPTSTQAPTAATETVPFPTFPPTVTSSPRPSPSPTEDILAGLGQVILQDDFNLDTGWDLGERPGGAVSLLNGRLAIAVHIPGAVVDAVNPTGPMTDFYAEVEGRTEVCTDSDEFGLMFRVNADREHYRFTLTCDGGARVSRFLVTGEVGLVPLSETYTVFPGAPADNRIGVLARGDRFQFFINGLEVFTARDPSLTSGAIGLIVRSKRGGQTTVSFDNLVVRALLTSPTPPPP